MQLLFATQAAPLSVLALDLDKFKVVNDTMGHPEVDRFLKRYMEIVRDLVGDRGDGYRIGGDEVMVSLQGTALDGATVIAERIRGAVAAAFQAEPVAATTSIGVATFSGPVGRDVAAKFVDRRLYEAKEGGRNRICAAAFVASAE